MENKKIGIMGYGEIGKAVASFYDDPFIHDPFKKEEKLEIPNGTPLDILHVCIPYLNDAQFIGAVRGNLEKWDTEHTLVLIHSTVAVGTTEKIREFHKAVVHTPVRGIHPHLREGILTFTKFIGADDPTVGRLAAEHLQELGMTVSVLYRSRASELLKLLDTTYYGLAIAYHSYANELCEKNGVSFESVMTEANQSYNEGYVKLDMPHVVRPVLYPPEGGIGGHCVVPNAELLKKQFGDDPLLDAILRHKREGQTCGITG